MRIIRNLFRVITCKHEYAHVRNIHGDEINSFYPIKRSEWECSKCCITSFRGELHYGEGEK